MSTVDEFLERIEHDIRRHGLLRPGQTLVAGVSGGADSLALMDALRRLGFDVHVAHLNHALRPEASEDADAVSGLARELGLPVTVERAEVSAFAVSQRLSVEEAARILRYRFLARAAAEAGTDSIAVGHTADDQVETVLMHFLRGSGMAGLRGMLPKTDLSQLRLGADLPPGLQLVRPLLSVWREDTEKFCEAAGLRPRTDITNQDVTIFRNRLRHELLPHLRQFNPRVKDVIARTAQVLAADHEVLEASVDRAWREVVLRLERTSVQLSRPDLLRQPLGLRRGLVRRAISMLRPGLRDIDFGPVEQAVEFAGQPPKSGQADLAAGLMIEVAADRVTIREWTAGLAPDEYPHLKRKTPLPLGVPGETRLDDSAWTVTAVEQAIGSVASPGRHEDRWTAYFDAAQIESPMTLRPRGQGDRIRPMGMGGHSVKLSDLMINCKIPRFAREGWPVLVAGGEVLWVPGLRQSEVARVTEQTARVVRVELSKRA